MNNLINLESYLCGKKDLLNEIIELNEIIFKKGLYLSELDAQELMETKLTTLNNLGRIEINQEIVCEIICEFYDSPYIDKYNYLLEFKELIRVFYYYQSILWTKLTDEQILKYLKECFDGEAAGNIELLYEPCLNNLIEKIESGVNE